MASSPSAASALAQAPSVPVLGVPIQRLTYADLLARLDAWIAGHRSGDPARQVCTVNPEFLVDAQRNPAFAAVLREADACVADGVGVAWAARRAGSPVPERITGSDGIYRLCAHAAVAGWRVYFLGAAPGVAEQAATILRTRYAGLQVAGTFSGSPAAADWVDIEQRLHAARPDLLFVAFGHPKQDLWIAAHKHELPSAVALGVGGAFDFVAGVTPRAPVWMRRAGIEWLHRLITQPWRWRRMLKLPLFVWLVLTQRKAIVHG